MSWQDERQPASFRGLAFEATDVGESGGHRLVVDEYPQTDDHSVVSLGASAKRFRVRGFVYGADYLDRLGNLEAAFRQPGAGELVHPWRGRLSVLIETYEITHDLSGGVGEFEISCVIAGLETRPLVLVITETDIIDKGEAAIASSRSAYQTARLAYLERSTAYLSRALSAAVEVESLRFEEALGVVVDLTGTETEVLDEMAALAGASDDLARLVRYLKQPRETNAPHSTGTPREELARDLWLSSFDYVRTACLARVCQLSTTQSYTSADAAEDMQREVDALLEAAIEVPPDDLTFESLGELRASFIDAIVGVSERLPRLRELRLVQPLPSLVVSCDLYGTTDREDEIIQLNRIANPFIVGGVLRVLSS